MPDASTRNPATSVAAPTPAGAPIADRRPVVRAHHGHTFADPYEWLRDKDNPEVIAHLEAENAWTSAQTAHLAPLRQAIVGEIKARTQETDLSVPVRTGDWWYYSRTIEGQQYPVHARAAVAGPDDWNPPVLDPGVPVPGEQILLDSNAEADGHEFFSLGSFDVSADGTLLAYAIDTAGDERYTLRLRRLPTESESSVEPGFAPAVDLPEAIPDTAPGATLSPCGRFVFYTTVDDSWRPDTVWRHAVGEPAGSDVQVFHEPDDRFWVGVGLSRSDAYLQIDVASKVTSETLLIPADDPTSAPVVVWARRDGVEYNVEHAVLPGSGDVLVICHNADGENFAIVTTAVPHAGVALDPATALTVVAHDLNRRIEGVDAFAGFLAVSYREAAVPRVGIMEWLSGGATDGSLTAPWQLVPVGADGALSTVALGANASFEQPRVRLTRTSFIQPAQVVDYDVASGLLSVLKEQPVLGGYNPEDYAQQRTWATAKDGTQVPVSLVWRKDQVATRDGRTGDGGDEHLGSPEFSPVAPTPLRLYGYGSYEISIDPAFSVARLSALDRGAVFAVAHVRGGGEMGRGWYEDGKTLTKRNTFTDFVACARHLIDIGWTAPDRLVAEGGSAGGLLMGAVANLAPELFTGIVADVPFVDPLTSILDPELPLTVIEWDEWGNPLTDPAVYEYMRSYSPYENVRKGVTYPRILAITSLNDTRVLYVEPAKWVARLREVGAPALLKIEMSAGHGGVSGRYAQWEEAAFELAWVLDVLGLE